MGAPAPGAPMLPMPVYRLQMQLLSIVVVLTWPNYDKPNNELSLQQVDNATVIKADGELSI